MKKFRFLAFGVALLLLGVLFAPVAVQAADNVRSGNTASVGQGESIDASVYLAGTTVSVAGTVKGDVYCAGQTVDVTGTVEGDVICAGQTVNISGKVLGDVRVAGQMVNVSGSVARSLTAFGQSVMIAGNAVVNMDATVYGTTVQLAGKVGRDAMVGGQQVTVAGTVDRNINAQVDKLTLSGGARVGGDVEYTSYNELDKGNGSAVSGQTMRYDPPADRGEATSAAGWIGQFWGVVYWLAAWLVLGLLLLALTPRSYKATSDVMVGQVGWALLAGLAALIMTPIVAVLLMVTVIGIPAGIALLLLWGVAMLMAMVYGGFTVGQWVSTQVGWKLKWPAMTSLALGLVVLALLMLIPFVGGLFSFLAMVWGLGGIALAVGSSVRSQRNVSAQAKKAKA